MSCKCNAKTRLSTLEEVADNLLSARLHTLEGLDKFSRWLQREIIAVRTETLTPQGSCNCNIGGGDFHAAQCAVWDLDTLSESKITEHPRCECLCAPGNCKC